MALSGIQKLMVASLDRLFNMVTNPDKWDEKRYGKKSNNIKLLNKLNGEICRILKHPKEMSDEEKTSIIAKIKDLNEYLLNGLEKQMTDPNITEWDEMYGKEKDALANACILSSIELKIEKIERYLQDLPDIEQKAYFKKMEKDTKMLNQSLTKLAKVLENDLDLS